ncbi:MAG TPA: YtxH domain-containing protein [Bacteroidia bacterium]|jgi:gas vesicle protein|nr:YtxH domain-containing protein [Bacteroidia bacterium]
MERKNETGELIGAVLLGIAIGGVLGVLFAPDKGSETRKKLMGTINGLTEDIKNKMQCEQKNDSVDEEKVV